MTERNNIENIQFYRINRNDSVYIDAKGINNENLDFLLDYFPQYRSLFFYDHYFPQRSDPGAYVTVYRYKYEYAYWLGNHGWTTLNRFQKISKYFLKRYILKNIKYNENNFGFGRIGEKEDQITKKLVQEFYIKSQLKTIDYPKQKVFEVNGYYLLQIEPNQTALEQILSQIQEPTYIKLNEEQIQIFESSNDKKTNLMFEDIIRNQPKYKSQLCEVK